MSSILCIGGMTMDIMMRLSHFPSPGETVVTDNVMISPGGKTSNQAATIAKLGGNVHYLTKLGGDDYSRQLIKIFVDYGIVMDHVLIDDALMAGIAMVQVDSVGQNACAFCPGASLSLTSDEVLESHAAFQGRDALLISMEVKPEVVYAALRLSKQFGMTTVLDPSPMPKEGIGRDIAELVDYVKPNETETEMLSGVEIDSIESAFIALEQLEALGYKQPIITLGQNGCVFRDKETPIHFPAKRVKSIDTTAAGDVFLGSLVLKLSDRTSLLDSIEFASTAAAICTTMVGAQSAIPTYDQVIAALNKDY